MRKTPILLASCASLVLLTGAKPPQKTQTFTAEYEVSYLAFTVAEATITSKLTGDSIVIDGKAGSAGLVRLFDRTTGQVSAKARIQGDAIEPLHYKLSYKMGKKPANVTEIHFDRGDVSKAVNKPEGPKPKKQWIPLGDKDLMSVFDPLTSVIIKASGPAEVCKRTIRAFDGQMRADIVMKHKGVAKTVMPGFSGPAVTCTIGYKPVSGYRKDRKDLIDMRDKTRLEATFAPVGKTGLYVPVFARAKADFGTVTIRARRAELKN